MKNNDRGQQFRSRLIINIFYSALIAVLIEIFLIANVYNLIHHTYAGSGSNILNLLNNQTFMTVIFTVIGILIFTGTWFLFNRRSFQYIGEISDAIERIADGDLSTTIEVAGDDEFSAMADNLNHMAADIRVLMDKERESERTKNDLITNVAHDLRTPLTSVTGYLEILSRGMDLSPEVQQNYVNIAYAKAKRLEKLIEDLFGFTKMTYGKMNMNVGTVDIVKLVGQLLEESYPNFMNNGLSYELTSNVPAQNIQADGNLLARLFDNLIGNAIKYGADGKKVIVSVMADEEHVTVAVKNFGKVIPANELPYVFEKFYRVEQSRSSKTGGTGLGLAIAKNITEMHGGKISVKSDLEGTVFTVVLKIHFDVNLENFND